MGAVQTGESLIIRELKMGGSSTKPILVRREHPRQPLVSSIFPVLSGPIVENFGRQGAVIYIFPRDRCCGTIAESLRSIFGLTGAEARLAVLLVEGKALSEVMKTLNVSRNTVKSQIHNIFGKTNTTSQIG